jgi:hypothetical protein
VAVAVGLRLVLAQLAPHLRERVVRLERGDLGCKSVALGGALREFGVCFVNALGELGSLTPSVTEMSPRRVSLGGQRIDHLAAPFRDLLGGCAVALRCDEVGAEAVDLGLRPAEAVGGEFGTQHGLLGKTIKFGIVKTIRLLFGVAHRFASLARRIWARASFAWFPKFAARAASAAALLDHRPDDLVPEGAE